MKYKIFSNTILLLIAVTISSCGITETDSSFENKNFHIEFIEGGTGVSGFNLSIDHNNRIKIIDNILNIDKYVNSNEIEELKYLFFENNFFSLKTEYRGNRITFGAWDKINFFSDEYNKSVTVHMSSETPFRFSRIKDYLKYLSEEKINQISSGKVSRENIYTLVKWPFPDTFPLNENLETITPLTPETKKYIIEEYDHSKKYFENGWIYRITFRDEDKENASMQIYDRYQPYRWDKENTTSIKDFEDGSLFINGDIYKNIDSYFSDFKIQHYFIDGEIEEGNKIYIMRLYKGNGWEHTPIPK